MARHDDGFALHFVARESTAVHDFGHALYRTPRREWILLFAALASAGCDLTGQYDKKFQESLQAAAKKAVFEGYLHSTPTEVVDSSRQPIGVRLRLPRVFDSSSRVIPMPSIPGMPALPFS